MGGVGDFLPVTCSDGPIAGRGVNDQGEHFCNAALWAEGLEGEIIQTCPSQIILPAKG